MYQQAAFGTRPFRNAAFSLGGDDEFTGKAN